MLDKASRLYNRLLELYANKSNRLEKNKKKKIVIKIGLKKWVLKHFIQKIMKQ